jgi:dynein light chain roadblock-type
MADVAAVDEAFKRLQSHKGVLGAIVVNADGIAIRSTFDNDVTVQYAALVTHFTTKARSAVRKLDGENE